MVNKIIKQKLWINVNLEFFKDKISLWNKKWNFLKNRFNNKMFSFKRVRLKLWKKFTLKTK